MVGVSATLHEDLRQLSETIGLPVTVMLETWLERCSEIDWESIKKDYELRKPTWQNIRRKVQEYQSKYPDADDKKLSEMTGYSLAQVETATHSAHKRCLAYMKTNPRCKEKRIAEACGVSPAFAKRIYEQFHNGAKVPKAERYLFK